MKKEISWEDIYVTMSPKMLGICRRYVKSQTTAEDLVHEAFIQAYKMAHTFKGTGSFEGWISRIMVNISLQYLRNQNKSKEVLADVNELDFTEPDDNETPLKSQKTIIQSIDYSHEELLQVIDEIPDHYKMVFNLHVFEGKKHKQIAKILDISPGTSKSYLSRAREKIQKLLYKKAMEKKKQHRGTRKQALWALFAVKPHFIDSIFKKKLSSYEISSTQKFETSKFFEENAFNHLITIKKSLLHVIVKPLLIGVPIISGTVLMVHIKNNNTAESPSFPITQDTVFKADTPMIMIQTNSDTLAIENKNQVDSTTSQIIAPDTVIAKEVPIRQPVIVKKSVVVKKTIYK